MGEPGLQQQIAQYLVLLSNTEKQAILTVVKSMALSKTDDEDIWEDEAFAKEMKIRTKEYENGKASLVKFEDLKREAIKVYEAKKQTKG